MNRLKLVLNYGVLFLRHQILMENI